MGWTPATLYAATLPELIFAFRGWQRANGIDPDAEDNKPKPMTRARLEALEAEALAMKKRQQARALAEKLSQKQP